MPKICLMLEQLICAWRFDGIYGTILPLFLSLDDYVKI